MRQPPRLARNRTDLSVPVDVISDYTQNPRPGESRVQSLAFSKSQKGKGGPTRMNWNWKRLILGVLTALAMMAATYVLPRGGTLREASLAQFPMTVGVWAIFVLLFVKLK